MLKNLLLVYVFCLCALLQSALVVAQPRLSSSDYELLLDPTEQELEDSAKSELFEMMSATLLSSASTSSGYQSLSDLEAIPQRIYWTKNETSTKVKFEVVASFLPGNHSIPTQYSLDSLIVTTFSLPSDLLDFLSRLSESQHASLRAIEEVSIQLASFDDDALESYPETASENKFSSLDVVLISVCAVIGAILLFFIYIQLRNDESIGLDEVIQNEPPKTRESNLHPPRGSESDVEAFSVGSNISLIDTVSSDKSHNYTLEVTDVLQADIASVDSVGNARSVAASVPDEERGESPPQSPASSTTDESTPPTSPVRCSDMTGVDITDYILGAPPPNYPDGGYVPDSPSGGSLASRLLRLGSFSQNSFGSPCRSTVSAPAKLVGISSFVPLSSGDSNESQEKSSRSSRSTPDSFSFMFHPHGLDSRTPSSATDLAVISEQSVLASGSESFENDWRDSQMLALENEDEESADDDVFGIDVEKQKDIDDSQSRVSRVSAVSDWLKSIHVVASSTERGTTTSDSMSQSSSTTAENEVPMESVPLEHREVGSVSESLEASLATSVVDV
eukprot:Nitzschia sp. Nitz4//scaffold86_size83305//5123//6808//NITZ4_005248-RA/size83305-processed-gene-0.92-mRNA-1//-1//CDS//3329559208//7219//frame0